MMPSSKRPADPLPLPLPPTARARSGTRAPVVSNDVPTEELVRVLNERLRDPSQWDAGESPPVYQGS